MIREVGLYFSGGPVEKGRGGKLGIEETKYGR